MPVATNDILLTRRQAAEVLGFQPQTLARWKWEGREDRPPEVRIGSRAIRYRAGDLATWIAEHCKRHVVVQDDHRRALGVDTATVARIDTLEKFIADERGDSSRSRNPRT